MTQTVSFELPEGIDLSEVEARFLFAGELHRKGKISLGQAAEMVGVTKFTFIEMMGKYGFSIFSESVEDLLHDIEHA